MKTEMLTVQDINTAAQIIKDGGIVAMPTETVYGLAANALDGRAVANIFKAKGRPMDNPLIVHIADINEIDRLVADFPIKAQKLAQSFWPGPLTMILRKSDIIPDEVSAGLDTVAVRFPSHPVARELIRISGVPLAAPSANLSGSPSPTTAEHVLNDMDGKIEAILDGGVCAVGLESTVITLTTDIPRVLRPGGVTVEQLRDVIGEVRVDPAVFNEPKANERVSSPGMKYKHYSPKAHVIIVNSSSEKYIEFINSQTDSSVAALCYEEDEKFIKDIKTITYGKESDPKSQAYKLFDALRKIDELNNIKTVFARCPQKDGVGMAVYNRLIRAAGFEVLDVI